jgi:hypothetical protein
VGKYRYIVLDAFPLSNCVISVNAAQTQLTVSESCRQWLTNCERGGASILVPAIVYYEELRELERRQAFKKIDRMKEYCFQPDRFVPLTIAHLESAAKLWGQMRRSGRKSADDKALDGDVILSAQVLSLGLSQAEYVVATTNVKHLKHFVNADEWQNIGP